MPDDMTWIAPVYLRLLMDRARACLEPSEDPAILAEALQYAQRALDGEAPGPESAEPEPERSASIAVGAVVRAARENAGMTQSALAAKVGVTQTAVSYWEAAKRDIGIADLERIADALGVTAGSLLPVPHRAEPASPDSSLPDGEYARVEILGHDHHTGWVTESTRAGQPVMVVRDFDGLVVAEVPGHSLYRFVPLATPLKRPEPQAALPAGAGFDHLYDEMPDDSRDF